jgi:hypothetical protein
LRSLWVELEIEVLQSVPRCDNILSGNCKSEEKIVEQKLQLRTVPCDYMLGEAVDQLSHQDLLALCIDDLSVKLHTKESE